MEVCGNTKLALMALLPILCVCENLAYEYRKAIGVTTGVCAYVWTHDGLVVICAWALRTEKGNTWVFLNNFWLNSMNHGKKTSMVTRSISQHGTFTWPVVVIKCTFPSLALVRYYHHSPHSWDKNAFQSKVYHLRNK